MLQGALGYGAALTIRRLPVVLDPIPTTTTALELTQTALLEPTADGRTIG